LGDRNGSNVLPGNASNAQASIEYAELVNNDSWAVPEKLRQDSDEAKAKKRDPKPPCESGADLSREVTRGDHQSRDPGQAQRTRNRRLVFHAGV
jgi:hypothetical protein